MGKRVDGLVMLGRLAFIEQGSRLLRATSTLEPAPGGKTEFLEAADTIASRIADRGISDAMAKANVHGNSIQSISHHLRNEA